MKYWRGFIAAAIIALCSWALLAFAASHSTLVDMVYPYVSRMLQTSLADWTGGADFLLWQVLLAVLLVGMIASAVLMILLRWNFFQWLGWILTGVSIVFFLHTATYGLNKYAGCIAGDIRMNTTEYTLEEINDATIYFRDKANELASQVTRDSKGNADFSSFEALASQAGEGYRSLVYDKSYSIFAGSLVPVKELNWTGLYTPRGVSGVTISLTGESAVNPKTPDVALPFAMCHEMAHRMSISADGDADFSAFLACQANSSLEFQYSAYVMAYRNCIGAMTSINSNAANEAIRTITAGVSDLLAKDLEQCNRFNNDGIPAPNRISGLTEEGSRETACDLLVSWYIQEFILPIQIETDTKFDPYDETKVDLSGIVNAKKEEETNATNGQ